MTVESLIALSGIKNEDGVTSVDYSIPMNADGTYPHGGRAVAVYRRGSHIPLIVSYALLAELAISNLLRDNMWRLLDDNHDESNDSDDFYRTMSQIQDLMQTLVGGRELSITLSEAIKMGHHLPS